MSQLSVLPQLQQFCQFISESIRKQDFLTYFQRISLVSEQDGMIVIGVVSEFVRDNMAHRFSPILLESAKKVWSDASHVEIVVDQNIENPSYAQVIDCRKALKTLQASREKKENVKLHDTNGKEDFSSRFDLSHFVVGQSNQLAYSACEAVIRKPGANYNPLFIYSDVGLGKTHLLQ